MGRLLEDEMNIRCKRDFLFMLLLDSRYYGKVIWGLTSIILYVMFRKLGEGGVEN